MKMNLLAKTNTSTLEYSKQESKHSLTSFYEMKHKEGQV